MIANGHLGIRRRIKIFKRGEGGGKVTQNINIKFNKRPIEVLKFNTSYMGIIFMSFEKIKCRPSLTAVCLIACLSV